MKKFFLIAASALMVIASCTKVNVNYPDNGQPQEIALFSVNKNMVKAPVTGTTFSAADNMRVSAYLASVTGGTPASYFENILFNKQQNGNNWVAGQYWPISAATLNFVAVTQKGGGVDLKEDKIAWSDNKFTVTVDYNTAGDATADPAVSQTYNQSDIMYASVRASNNGDGSAPSAVDLEFNHALAWIKFAFKSNVTTEGTLVINSVELYAPYNGTLTVTPDNYTVSDANSALNATAAWTDPGFLKLKVSDQSNALPSDMDLKGVTDYTAFGSGMLVVPNTAAYTGNNKPYFTINYTIKQGDGSKQYSYKHDLSTVVWEMGKKYTYNINITLHEIKVSPTVGDWTPYDNDNTTAGNQDIPVDLG